MQTLLVDPHKLSSCLSSHASWAPNFPMSSRNISKSPTIYPSGAWAWLQLKVFVWAGSLSLGGSRHVSVPLWFFPTLYLVHKWVWWPKKLQNLCLWGHPGPWSWAEAAWWVYQFCWQTQYWSHRMVWDWAIGMMLTLWFWVILTHLDMEWIQDSELPPAHSQPLSLTACEVSWIFTHPSYSQHGDDSGPQYPKWHVKITSTPLLLAPRAVYSSFCRLCPTGNTVLGGRGGRVALPTFSKGFLDCCSKLSMGSSNPCPLFSLIDAVTVLSWVKLIHMKVLDSLHKWDHLLHPTDHGG